MPGGVSSGFTAMSVRRCARSWRVLVALSLVSLATSASAPTRGWAGGHWCIHDLFQQLNTLSNSPGT